MALHRVWFNKGFSGVYRWARALGSNVHALTSHTSSEAIAFYGGEGFLEPKNLSGTDYVDYCLDTCRKRQIDLFIPSKEQAVLTDCRDAFERQGTRLMVTADSATLDLLDNKAEFLQNFDASIVPILPFEVFSTHAGFERAVQALSAPGVTLCFKPSRGIYGHGFHVLVEREQLSRMIKGDTVQMEFDHARRLFASEAEFKPLLLMHYAEGIERSVDCLAHRGTLVTAICRVKHGATQWLEDRPDVVEIARSLAERYRLNGIFNFQLRDHNGVPHLLEINARPSGGLFISMQSGVNMVDWLVRLELGLASISDVPSPKLGFPVGRSEVAVSLEGPYAPVGY